MTDTVDATRVTHLVNGAAWEGSSERTSEIFNPATGVVTGVLDLASKELVDEIIGKAAVAAQEWGQTSIAKRTKILFKFRELLEANKGEIAKTIVAEHGKTYVDAVGEINRGLARCLQTDGFDSIQQAIGIDAKTYINDHTHTEST